MADKVYAHSTADQPALTGRLLVCTGTQLRCGHDTQLCCGHDTQLRCGRAHCAPLRSNGNRCRRSRLRQAPLHRLAAPLMTRQTAVNMPAPDDGRAPPNISPII